MVRINKFVKDNFLAYGISRETKKVVEHNRIRLNDGKDGHKNFNEGVTLAYYSVAKANGQLRVRQNKESPLEFGFQLFAPGFDPPIMRFDASGPAHENRLDKHLTAEQRTVKTPHYHVFNEHGIEIAYRTPHLDKNEYIILEDINFALKTFCAHANVHSQTGEDIVALNQMELFPSQESTDVLKGTDFP